MRLPGGAGWLALTLWIVCLSVGAEPVAPADLQTRFDELTPECMVNVELVPDEIALLGADRPSGLRQAAPFQVTLYFTALEAIPPSFSRDLLFSLGSLDIARVPVTLDNVPPGGVVKRAFDLYVPRCAPIGANELRVGFLTDKAPGEMKREDWTYRRARALAVEVASGDEPGDIAPDAKAALLKSMPAGENLLANGSFDDGWAGWRIDQDILEGVAGWNRVLAVRLDQQVAVEPPFSLRVDFAGGHDTDFYALSYHVDVKPNTGYTLSYLIRTENITSGGAPCLDVMAPGLSYEEFYVIPPAEKRLTGTHPWTLVSVGFTTPPDARELRIKVRRHGSGPSRYQPKRWGPISGTVWFDAIRLTQGAP